MISLVNSTITGTVVTILLIGVFIFAVLDPNLPIHWKIIVCFIIVILTYGSITVLRQNAQNAKKQFTNKEDLR